MQNGQELFSGLKTLSFSGIPRSLALVHEEWQALGERISGQFYAFLLFVALRSSLKKHM